MTRELTFAVPIYIFHMTSSYVLETCLLSFAHKYLDRSGSPATTPLPTPQEEWVTLNSSVKSHTILKYPSSPHVFPGKHVALRYLVEILAMRSR